MSKQQLIDRSGNQIFLGSELGKGGEGAVFHVQGKPNVVAKVYFKPPDTEKSYKIINMVSVSTERLLKLAAWPLDSIHHRSGDLVGFMMQKLQGYRPLFELYSPKLRLQEFPQADWRFLIHAATNTARAFSVVHEAGHVIGDVNHGNLLVANDATVKFIDTDSFQISVNGKNWLCEVGVATHQPPEMQGRTTYRDIIRTPNHDNFGLAVLIFQLLCLARHPFSGRFLGQGDMPLEKAIAECRFAYTRDNRFTQMNPPPASLPMSALPPRIWLLFEKAFSKEGSADNMRPNAKDWVFALEELAASLKVCQSNQGHYYFNTLGSCPWCDIEMKSNAIIFPVIVRLTYGSQNFETLWQQVLRIKDPGPAPSLPDVTTISLPPSKEVQELKKKIKRFENSALSIGGIALIGFLFGDGNLDIDFSALLLPFGLLGLLGVYLYREKKKQLTKDISQKFVEIKAQWIELSANWANWVNVSAYKNARHELDELKLKYDDLQKDRQSQLQKLWNNRRKQQLHAHLDRYQISTANVDGVGPGRLSILQSYGIETAADIDPWRIDAISGFGPKLVQRLIDWKYRCELAFVFNSSQEVSQREVQMVDRDIVGKRRKLEQELATGIAHLTRISNQITERRKQLYSQASNLRSSYAQAIANAQEIGLNP